MSNTDYHSAQGGLSMRRTLLTLLGGFAAFAILTASYATADLPAPADHAAVPIASVE